MEKIENRNNPNSLVEKLVTPKAKYIIGTFLLSGVGVALPRIFHTLAGSSAGATFLPMHIAVFVAALVFGSLSASIVAGSSVMVSYWCAGMPSLVRLPYMLVELVIYAVLLGLFHKKWNTYSSLIATLVLGRILYAGVLFVAVRGLGLPDYGLSVIQSVQRGVPGIVLQLMCVPIVSKIMQKGLYGNV